MRAYHIYILASRSRRLYVGMTSALERRVWQHRAGQVACTRKYRMSRLVHVETTTNVHEAVAREKQLKKWRREKKIALIERSNPLWHDLAEGWTGPSPTEQQVPAVGTTAQPPARWQLPVALPTSRGDTLPPPHRPPRSHARVTNPPIRDTAPPFVTPPPTTL